MARWIDNSPPFPRSCITDEGVVDPIDQCSLGEKGGKSKVALWGDSHSQAISQALSLALAREGVELFPFVQGGCSPVLGVRRLVTENKNCHLKNAKILDYLISDTGINAVIMFSRWTLNMESTRFDNGEGGVEYGFDVKLVLAGQNTGITTEPIDIDRIGELYRATITRLLDEGERVVLTYPTPEVGWDVPRYLTKRLIVGAQDSEPLSTSYAVYKQRSGRAVTQLDKLDDHVNLVRIHPDRLFCNTRVEARCVAELNGVPLYIDDDHLNSVGSGMLSQVIVDALEQRGWLTPGSADAGP